MTNRMLLLVLLVTACATVRSPATTNPKLIVRRELMIQWLAEYEQRGVFPVDDRAMPASVFRDAHGVRCPMAELIFRSGRADLVDAVARDHNALRLADVHDGPLLQWMQTSGLTRDEIIMVQGALTLDEMRLSREYAHQLALETAAARGEVRGKLETAVAALRLPRVAIGNAADAGDHAALPAQ